MKFRNICLLCLVFGLWYAESSAQELTPRLFWPTPEGTTVMVAGYSYSSGDVFLDQSIPIEGADSNINMGILAYARTLDLWGRTSNVLVNLPYSWGNTRGFLLGLPVERDFNAFGDLSVTLNVNLRGGPTMTKEDFLAFRANPRPLIGASVKLVAPTGEYSSNRLINVGSNRWATRFKLGGVLILKPKLLLELSASTWIFGDDDDFLTGTKEQDPIFAVEANLIKRIRPGFWASLDLTYFKGGRQTIGGKPLSNYQKNLKLGGTVVFPFHRRHAIKIGYVSGVVTRYGNDFDQFLMSYQVILK